MDPRDQKDAETLLDRPMQWMMSGYTADWFGDAVMRNFQDRRPIRASASPVLETKALGHLAFEKLTVGEYRSATLAVTFLISPFSRAVASGAT